MLALMLSEFPGAAKGCAPVRNSCQKLITFRAAHLKLRAIRGNGYRWLFHIAAVYALALPLTAWGQSSAGLIGTNRAIDWTGMGMTVPTVTTACSTQPTLLTGSGNAAANSTSLNNAISADKGGASYCVINLPAGTYFLGASITLNYSGKANLVIRGAGANQTFLIWTSGASFGACNGLNSTAWCIYNGDTGGWNGVSGNGTWSGPYTQGTTTINLSDHTDLYVGSQIWLGQANTTDPGNAPWPCDSGGAGTCSQQSGSGVGWTSHSLSQSVIVTGCGASTFGTACTSNSVSITPALRDPNWNSGQSPIGKWSFILPVSNFGIENLSTDTSQTSVRLIYELHNAVSGWLSGIRSINNTVTGSAASEHILLWGANHITVQNSYFYGSNPSSEGYAISPAAGTSDSLFVNNICQHLATCWTKQSAQGNVFAYNYAIDNYFGSSWQIEDESHHGAGDHYNLQEGNIGTLYEDDTIHGSAWFETTFRNYFSGKNVSTSPGAGSVFAMFHGAYSRYGNDIANVLGTAGWNTTYQQAATAANVCNPSIGASIYQIGWSDQGGTTFSNSPDCGVGAGFVLNNDLLTVSSLSRWGNWDAVTNAVRECKTGSSSPCTGDETGSSAPTYPGLANPSTTFPASFVYASAPSWWVFPSGITAPFPGIGPDVTGGNIVGTAGHAYLNPAANCYLNVIRGPTNGSATPQAFDPSACYTGTPTAATPTYSPAAGSYATAQYVRISSTTSGATLHYTTDGSTPTTASPVYATPILVAQSQTLKAIATASGFSTSAVGTAGYVLPTAATKSYISGNAASDVPLPFPAINRPIAAQWLNVLSNPTSDCNTYNWAPLDSWISASASHGSVILYTFSHVPQCANGTTNFGNPPTDIGSGNTFFANFVTAFMKHICGVSSPPGSPLPYTSCSNMKYIELWNEANVGKYWTGTAAQMASMWNAAIPIIRTYCSSCEIVGGSTSAGGKGNDYYYTFLLSIYQNLTAYPDLASFHPYPSRTSVEPVPFPTTIVSNSSTACTALNTPNVSCDVALKDEVTYFQTHVLNDATISSWAANLPIVLTEGAYGINDGVCDGADCDETHTNPAFLRAAYAGQWMLMLAAQHPLFSLYYSDKDQCWGTVTWTGGAPGSSCPNTPAATITTSATQTAITTANSWLSSCPITGAFSSSAVSGGNVWTRTESCGQYIFFDGWLTTHSQTTAYGTQQFLNGATSSTGGSVILNQQPIFLTGGAVTGTFTGVTNLSGTAVFQ